MEQEHNLHEPPTGIRHTRWKLVVLTFLSVGALALVSTMVFLFYFTDPFINTFLKGRITDALREAYPKYSIHIGSMHYNIQENRVEFDSVALSALDSSLSCTIAEYSVSGIGWWKLLWARGFVPNGFTGTVLDAHKIVVRFPQELYELRCATLHVSVPDSEVVVDTMTLHPWGNDLQFFSGSKFRRTRYRVGVSRAVVRGLSCLELLQGKGYRTRAAHMYDVFIDVLINKEKSAARDTTSPPMPNEILATLEQSILIDSLNLWNAGLSYGERFGALSTPAVITLDSMQVLVAGLKTRGNASDTVAIRASGIFMNTAEMNIQMLIPVGSPEFSFQYSGSVRGMKLNVLNAFLEPAEQMRIKSGSLQSGVFDINVTAGRAHGNVRAIYKDLTLAVINERTGSESGIFDAIASMLANNIKIRRNNTPGNSMKVGIVSHKWQRDEPFFQFAWFSLRSGVGDVVGF